MDRFSYRIFQTCLSNNLIARRDKLLISVSGGVDSIALFHVLVSFRLKLDLGLHVVHFNHRLRPESEEEASFVTGLAEEYDVPASIINADHLNKNKGMQNEARKWRYSHLNRLLEELSFDKIALGHHLNDLVETQIWRMTRGASLFSLSPISEINPPYIRPLLRVPKAELEEFVKRISQSWRDDSSNFENDYTRNAIRNQLFPLLRQLTDGEKFEKKMLALYQDSLRLKEMFDSTVPRSLYEIGEIAYKSLLDLPQLFAHEVIHRFLIYHGQTEISRSNIQDILRLVETGRGDWTINLKEGLDVYGRSGTLRTKRRGKTDD